MGTGWVGSLPSRFSGNVEVEGSGETVEMCEREKRVLEAVRVGLLTVPTVSG